MPREWVTRFVIGYEPLVGCGSRRSTIVSYREIFADNREQALQKFDRQWLQNETVPNRWIEAVDSRWESY